MSTIFRGCVNLYPNLIFLRNFNFEVNYKMGRRYFCDYCEKTFIDDLEARKKHLTSSHHIKLRKLHYEHHRDPRTLLAEESIKTTCRRFILHGECQFAGNCKYTHYSQEELWNLKQQIELCGYGKKRKAQEVPDIPSLEPWLEKYNQKHNKADEEESVDIHTSWSYPEHLECRSDLPPSMKKFKPEDFKDDIFEEWGV